MSLSATSKSFISLVSALLLTCAVWGPGDALAQDETTVSIESQEVEAGQSADVPVEVSGFNDVGGLQLEIEYDPEVVSFPNPPDSNSTEDLISNPPRDGFSAQLEEEGTLSISWFDNSGENPLNIGSGTLLQIAVDQFEGGQSDVLFTENSLLFDTTGSELPATFQNGFVAEVGQAGTLSLGTVNDAALNSTVRVPISGENLENVGAVSLEIPFDTDVAEFEGLVGDDSGLDLGSNPNSANSTGIITIEGFNSNGVSLGQDFVELEFRFLGQESALAFDAVNSQALDAGENELELFFEDGELSGDDPTVTIPDQAVTPGEQVTVPVEASDLQAIGAASVEISFNNVVLSFDGSENIIGDNFSASRSEPGTIQLQGFDTGGVDPANNGGRLVDLNFTVGEGALGDGESTSLSFDASSDIGSPH
jgi:hypothetical protein